MVSTITNHIVIYQEWQLAGPVKSKALTSKSWRPALVGTPSQHPLKDVAKLALVHRFHQEGDIV